LPLFRLGYLTKGIAQRPGCLIMVVYILYDFTAPCNVIYMLIFIYFFSILCSERNLYTIKAVSFTEIRSIRRHTPALGWQYIIVVLSSGELLFMNMVGFIFIYFFKIIVLFYLTLSGLLLTRHFIVWVYLRISYMESRGTHGLVV